MPAGDGFISIIQFEFSLLASVRNKKPALPFLGNTNPKVRQ
jgi:hypothetical protein